jgi:hypothetical protein
VPMGSFLVVSLEQHAFYLTKKAALTLATCPDTMFSIFQSIDSKLCTCVDHGVSSCHVNGDLLVDARYRIMH